jgi:hypothetical protein
MSFRLTSIINIGIYQLNGGVNDVQIKRSVKEIVDTAVIKIPSLGLVQIINNKPSYNLPDSSIATSKLFNEGDPVIIQLGYNGQNMQEFKGFVRRVTASVPVVIECEGYAWQLRRTRVSGNWKSVMLLDFLTQQVAGTSIKLSQYIKQTELVNLKMDVENGLKSLEYLRDKCGFSVYFMFDTLYVGIEAGFPGNQNPPQHQLGWNTIKDDKLKWRLASDTVVQFRGIMSKGNNAKRPMVTAGDANGSVVTHNIANLGTSDAQTNIDDKLLQEKYNGFEGSFTAFLQPFTQMCDTDILIDKIYNKRGGRYFVQGVEVKFGMGGATREVTIGYALS